MGKSVTGRKALFMVYHGLSAHSGISKKILSQSEALRECGFDVTLCSTIIDEDGTRRRLCGDETLSNFGRGFKGKLGKALCFGDVCRYVEENGIEFVYIRHNLNSSPATLRLVRRLRALGAKVALEIPTWPYDGEFKGQGLKMNAGLALDKLFRKPLMEACSGVVLFTDEDFPYNVPVIRISNGIDFGKIPVCAPVERGGQLRMLSVANIHLWHGLDRLIEGMGKAPEVDAVLHIVGDGLEDVISGYRARAEELGISDRVRILGPMFGEELDREFEWANVAVGSLGRHRSGIFDIKTLKNREYAARGVPFFYSERDSDFENAPYIFKVPADESPVDVKALKDFLTSLQMDPSQIRESVRSLSWNAQMQKVVDLL